ncbi:MAG: hypothetical protein ACI4O4_01560, partial [Candidatus Ventricola sp.]
MTTGCLCALGCETLFGLSYAFTKWAVGQAGAGAAGLALLRVALLHPVLYFIGETLGIRLTTASESGVFLACIPVVSLAASSPPTNDQGCDPGPKGDLRSCSY